MGFRMSALTPEQSFLVPTGEGGSVTRLFRSMFEENIYPVLS